MRFGLLLLAAVLSLSGCGPSTAKGSESAEAAQEKEFGETAADMGMALLNGYIKKDSNIAVSPLPVITVCSMLGMGSKGKTREQIEAAMGMESMALARQLDETSTRMADSAGLYTAGSLWTKGGIRDIYKDMARDLYFADIRETDFGKDAKSQMNQWARDKTGGMVSSIIEDVKPDTACILISAASFKGKWESSFAESTGIFHGYKGAGTEAGMLRGMAEETVSLHGGRGFVKYYEGRGLAFIAILPGSGTDIEAFAAGISGKDLIKMWESRSEETAEVSIPAFDARLGADIKPVVERAGIRDIFTKGADFSGMSDQPITVDGIFHKARVVVTKDGTKAGAAAASSMAVIDGLDDTKELIFDRPFFYEIVDTSTGAPVFMGIVKETS